MAKAKGFFPAIALCALVGVGVESVMAQEIPKSVSVSAPSSGSPQPSIDDIRLTPETTRDEIVATWGNAVHFGPALEMESYSLVTGEYLWLSYDLGTPRRLTRAVLVSMSAFPETTMLLNRIESTKNRRRGQLDFGEPITANDVYSAWGPPDSVIGSGLEYWVYQLADGEDVRLLFIDGRVSGSGGR